MHVLYASWGYTVHDRRFISAYTDAGHQVGHLRFDSERVFDTRPMPEGSQVLPFDRPLQRSAGAALRAKILGCQAPVPAELPAEIFDNTVNPEDFSDTGLSPHST